MKLLYYLSILFFLFLSISVTSQNKISSAQNSSNSIKSESNIQKIELINKSFDNYIEKRIADEKKDKSSIWDTLIPLLIGSILTIVTQFIFDYAKNKREKKQQVLESKIELEKLIFLIRGDYKELAMHKAHKHYWYAQFEFESNIENSNQSEVEKFYNFHIDSNNKARETESKISEKFSNFCKNVSKIQYTTSLNEKIDPLIQRYLDYVPNKPNDLFATVRSDLQKLARKEEDRLKNEYDEYLKILIEIKKILK